MPENDKPAIVNPITATVIPTKPIIRNRPVLLQTAISDSCSGGWVRDLINTDKKG